MEKKKFSFNKFGLVLCICFMALFAFIPFVNFNNISSVSASSITIDNNFNNLSTTNYNEELTSVVGKYWDEFDGFLNGSNVWTDVDNVYYSSSSTHYVLDKETSTWSVKTWNGLSSFSGSNVWTDGDNVYYSSSSTHYVLDKESSTWSVKTWNGLTSFNASNVWTDGDNVYYSSGTKHYVLDKETSTWSVKTWNGLTSFNGNNVWTDGDNVYYSSGAQHYVLDKETSTWSTKIWYGIDALTGLNVWNDGIHYYHSSSTTDCYVLDKETSTWSVKTWNGLYSRFNGSSVWTDGINYYSSSSSCSIQFTTKSEYELGVSDGYASGKSDGLAENGYELGVADGYASGKSDGLTEGYNNGYTEGKTDGLEEGYNNGYDRGYYIGVADTWGPALRQGREDGLAEGYRNGYAEGKTDGLEEGFDNGYEEALNIYSGFGPFAFSSVKYYVYDSPHVNFQEPITELYSGSLTSYECVLPSNGGFVLYDSNVENLMNNTPGLQIACVIDFGTPLSTLQYSYLLPLHFGSGNLLHIRDENGIMYFDSVDEYNYYFDTAPSPFKYISQIIIIMVDSDYTKVGLAFNTNNTHSYDLGFVDGKKVGIDEGYSRGLKIGYNNGYNVGMNDSNQYTFYNLFGAVLDAPVRVFSDLFNFELLGVNLLGLLTGLFTLAVVIVILKKFIGGK